MRTSSSQFEFIVTFMEQHGDLSKPPTNPKGRMETMKNWEELANVLNSDMTGETKSINKWQKVWSDFKNNTKKKTARIRKGTNATLSDVERRVLKIVGVPEPSSLPMEETESYQPSPSYQKGTPVFKEKRIPTENLVEIETRYFKIERETESDAIAKSWAKKINRLAPEQRHYAEKIINDTLFEGALGTLSRNGVSFLADSSILYTKECSPEYCSIPSPNSSPTL